MSKSSRYEWRDQQAALQERMKGFLANPGKRTDSRPSSPKCAPTPTPPQSGHIEIPQRWTSYN